EWVHVQLHQQKGMISLSPPTICNSAFDLSSPYGRMLATFLSGIAEFERDLISERVKSGLAVAKARGKRLGRQAGVRPKSDRLLPKVVAMRAEGRSYRWIARELGISKNTVADIVQRHRANA
ncbi:MULTISPECIES: recombinase family protein, partial [Citrobacter freundii complex]